MVTPGMKGKVLSLHDGFHLDVVQIKPIPPKAIVQFENGMTLMVDERMKWERVGDQDDSIAFVGFITQRSQAVPS